MTRGVKSNSRAAGAASALAGQGPRSPACAGAGCRVSGTMQRFRRLGWSWQASPCARLVKHNMARQSLMKQGEIDCYRVPLGQLVFNYLYLSSQKDPNYQIIILRTPGKNFMKRWEPYRVAFPLNTTLKSFTR